jgi:hypothetical protein
MEGRFTDDEFQDSFSQDSPDLRISLLICPECAWSENLCIFIFLNPEHHVVANLQCPCVQLPYLLLNQIHFHSYIAKK